MDRRALTLTVGLLLGLFVLASPVAAQGEPLFLRHFFRLPAMFDGQVLALEAMEIRPRGAGPFPLAVIAHGTPATTGQRQQYTVEQYGTVATELARHGFAAVVVMRRGFGASEGGFAETTGPCGQSRYLEAGIESARDLAETMRAMGSQPHIDARRVVVLGQSAGGFAALALGAQSPPGLAAIVNFAGGRGRFADRNAVCEPEKLVAAVAQFGRATRVAALWIYAENDLSFPPDLARAMYQSYRAGGAPAELAMQPPFRDDGHRLFVDGVDRWRPVLDGFLRRLGLPASPPRALPAPPAGLSERGKAAFQAYVAAPQPNKSFALGPRGAFAWRADAQPIDSIRQEALTLCLQHDPGCKVVSEVVELGGD
jgi:dienelactone hydrolase